MSKNVDKAALTTFTTELNSYKAPNSIHHDRSSVLALKITRQRTSDKLDRLIAEKPRGDL